MYIPISRRYRPQNFDEIVGQAHVTETLKNAIKQEKSASAYLFSGSQGVGKTSTARVLAKSLNCAKGPTITPCGKCSSCEEIAKGINLDVVEIDGASNRGIDEIRNLRENVKLKPISSKYKIYIIDEVHMLTAEAFNALLKTLEEPPSHVKFIFATTRPHKVLPTILSRCQRFDFHMLPVEVIIEKLKEIAAQEKISVDDDALLIIAKNAGGGMRDAQVMLDQVASFSKSKIRSQDVINMLGLLEQDVLFTITEAIFDGKSDIILDQVNILTNSGKDAHFICSSLIEHFRNMIVISSGNDDGKQVILSNEDREKMRSLSSKFSLDELFYVVYTLQNALEFIGRTSLGKIPLEVALLKLARKEKLIPLSDIMKRLEKLEGSGGPAEYRSPYSPSSGYTPEQSSRNINPPASYNKGAGADMLKKDRTDEAVPTEDMTQPEVMDQSAVATGTKDIDITRLKGIWPEIVRSVKVKKVSAGIYLGEGEVVGFKDNMVIVAFSRLNSLHKEALESKQNVDIIQQVLKDFTETDLGVSFIFSQVAEQPVENMPAGSAAAGSAPVPETPSLSRKIEPIIKVALDKFSGKIVKQYFVKEED